MTTEDKLKAMEVLWDDICRNLPDFSSPTWHEHILKEREQKLREGKDKFVDWDQAKRKRKEGKGTDLFLTFPVINDEIFHAWTSANSFEKLFTRYYSTWAQPFSFSSHSSLAFNCILRYINCITKNTLSSGGTNV